MKGGNRQVKRKKRVKGRNCSKPEKEDLNLAGKSRKGMREGKKKVQDGKPGLRSLENYWTFPRLLSEKETVENYLVKENRVLAGGERREKKLNIKNPQSCVE